MRNDFGHKRCDSSMILMRVYYFFLISFSIYFAVTVVFNGAVSPPHSEQPKWWTISGIVLRILGICFPVIDIVRRVLKNDPRLLLWNVISASECETYVRRYGTYDKCLCTRKGHVGAAGHGSRKLSVRNVTFMALTYFVYIFYDV